MKNDKIKVLDKGFIRLVEKMGTDSSITQAARVSYGDGTKSVSTDTKLIHYLYKNKHTSPFEMCELKFHLKMPMFIARQWLRHRTANVNEYSARYSIVKDEYYIPESKHICYQDKVNKQASGEAVPLELAQHFRDSVETESTILFDNYKYFLNKGISRETCRILLPQNIYTQFYWKIDLHNLLHFIRLRNSKHAQYEIRQYAKRILKDIIQVYYPITYEAFKKYK